MAAKRLGNLGICPAGAIAIRFEQIVLANSVLAKFASLKDSFMKYHDLRDATFEEQHEAISKILKESPPGTNAEMIEELTGIPKSTVWRIKKSLNALRPYDFSHHRELQKYVRENTAVVFGEEIQWRDSWQQLPGENGTMRADLVGEAADSLVIVEVKILKDDNTYYDQARESIGQVLHYLYASIYESVNDGNQTEPTKKQLKEFDLAHHLFIVGARYSRTVENMCKFLRAHGINIQHLSV